MAQQGSNSLVPKAEVSHEVGAASPRSASPSVRPKPPSTEDPPPTKQNAFPEDGLSSEGALALARHLGLNDAEIRFLITATPITPEEGQFAARVDSEAIARAYTPAVTAAFSAPGCAIAIGSTSPAKLEHHAAQVRRTVEVAGKLKAATERLELASRGSADVLDKVTREAVPQIRARSVVVRETEQTFSSVLAYHRTRYPGRTKKAKKPETEG